MVTLSDLLGVTEKEAEEKWGPFVRGNLREHFNLNNMTPLNFCYWLQGFFELSEYKAAHGLSAAQTQEINNHLSLVFKKVTPVVDNTVTSPGTNIYEDFSKMANRPKLSDGAHGRRQMLTDPLSAVRCSAWLGGMLLLLFALLLGQLLGGRFPAGDGGHSPVSVIWSVRRWWFLARSAYYARTARLLRLEARLLRGGFIFRRRMVQLVRICVFFRVIHNCKCVECVLPPNYLLTVPRLAFSRCLHRLWASLSRGQESPANPLDGPNNTFEESMTGKKRR